MKRLSGLIVSAKRCIHDGIYMEKQFVAGIEMGQRFIAAGHRKSTFYAGKAFWAR
jgi:hypothetical protein